MTWRGHGPRTEWIDGGKKRLTSSYVLNGDEVKKGTIIDGASVPGIFKWYADNDGALMPAAAVHDNDYNANPRKRTRRQADAKFYDNMIYTDVRWTQAWAAWSMVRSFGWAAYKGDEHGTG